MMPEGIYVTAGTDYDGDGRYESSVTLTLSATINSINTPMPMRVESMTSAEARAMARALDAAADAVDALNEVES